MSEKLHKKTDHTSDNSDSEFYDAPESISSKLNEQEEIIEDDDDDDDDDYDQDFESEKLDLLKKFDKKFNLDTNEPSPTTTSTKTDEKFQPLHEKLNAEEKAAKEIKTNDGDDNLDDETNPELDPYYVNEIELEKEQVLMSEQEKQDKLKEALDLKQSGNNLFKEENYSQALEIYTQALKCCPLDFKKERSVFYSNRSVCYLKTKENLKCINDCSKSIELDSSFIKPLLRRAECYQTEDKLDESLNDYKKLNELEPKYAYRQKCFELEEKIKERNEKLKNEMMDKLKDLGNMVLKPFGLSTNNFQFVQDPSTGSYSVNFKQN